MKKPIGNCCEIPWNVNKTEQHLYREISEVSVVREPNKKQQQKILNFLFKDERSEKEEEEEEK